MSEFHSEGPRLNFRIENLHLIFVLDGFPQSLQTNAGTAYHSHHHHKTYLWESVVKLSNELVTMHYKTRKFFYNV